MAEAKRPRGHGSAQLQPAPSGLSSDQKKMQQSVNTVFVGLEQKHYFWVTLALFVTDVEAFW